MENLRIIGITSENVKNLKLIHIEPKSDVVVISGPNAAGKSALLDSFWLALAGKDALKNYPDPIRHGEDHAKIEVDLGDIIVKRTWTKTNTYLNIENKDGAVFRSPQAMLDKLIGKLSFDPGDFALQNEKEQAETLMNLLGLTETLTQLNVDKKKVFDERTIINRQIKELNAQIKNIEVPDNVPDEEVSTVSIMDNYQKALATVNDNNAIRSNLDRQIERVEVNTAAVEKHKAELEQLEAILEEDRAHLLTMQSTINQLKDPDLERFKCNVEDAEKINNLVKLKASKTRLQDTLIIFMKKAKVMTNELIDIDVRKSDSIHDTKLPLEGLSFDINGVTYNDAPLKQCSSAEQLEVSLAVAMALNPTLRVIRIADGSLLDSTHMKIVEEMAEKHGFQVWVEVVDESGKMGIYIEDGSIVNDNYNNSNSPP